MYAKFFGLSQDPFSIAPDPRYLFMSERHREALAHLIYGLDSGGGFVLLSGEIGTGKTTVCRCFLEQVPANCNVAYIFNPKLTALELLRSICDEFHIGLAPTAATAKDFIDPLNEFLLRSHAAGHSNVLIIDEAQNLSADVLEQLRLLTNLETSERKLLQIILIGQPELRQLLAQPELEQLAQRVIARFHLDALSVKETLDYIAHRLAVAGLQGDLPFDEKALARIHQLSRGVPRRINLLCGRVLLGGYASGSTRVTWQMVDKAADEVFGPNQSAGRSAGVKISRSGNTSRRGYRAAAPLAFAGMAGLLLGAGLLGGMNWAQQHQTVPPSSTLAPATLGSAKEAAARPVLTALPSPAKPASTVASAVLTSLPGLTPVASGNDPLNNSSTSPTYALSKALVPPASGKTPAPWLSRAEFNAGLAENRQSQNQSWYELGQIWGLTLGITNPCQAALRQQVHCFRTQRTNLALIRELNRPGILTLFDEKERSGYAVLTGLSKQTATLRYGAQVQTVSLAVLAQIWRGDFATLWRAPAGYAGKTVDAQTTHGTAWLTDQLAKMPASLPANANGAGTQALPETTVNAKIYSFQLAQGLTPDGRAGPMTLMQLNRASGVDEPRLQTETP